MLLALMTGHTVVSRETIVRALGENFHDYDQRRLDTQMRRLRRKVEQACGLLLPVTARAASDIAFTTSARSAVSAGGSGTARMRRLFRLYFCLLRFAQVFSKWETFALIVIVLSFR